MDAKMATIGLEPFKPFNFAALGNATATRLQARTAQQGGGSRPTALSSSLNAARSQPMCGPYPLRVTNRVSR